MSWPRPRREHALASLVMLPRAATNDTTKVDVYSVAKVKAWLTTLPDIAPFIKDGTVVAVMVSDDITKATEFGPHVPYFAQIDSVAMLIRAKWPGAVPVARAKPTILAAYKWKWLRGGWAQYVAGKRDGPLDAYIASESVAAKAHGLCLILGMNFTKGGDGSSGRKTGSGFTGTTAQYEMSPDEVANYGMAELKAIRADPSLYMPVLPGWEWRADQMTRQRPGFVKLRVAANLTPTPRCT
jgi:hypothetical protein